MIPEIEALARRMYEAGTRSAPTWDQLGEITKSVWHEAAAEKYMEDVA